MSFRAPAFSASPRKFKTALLRHRVQRKLEKAVASGKVKKPNHCERCLKKFPKNKLQGHHRDYRKPLVGIKWYCQACHYKNHSPAFQANAAYRQMQRLSGIIGH